MRSALPIVMLLGVFLAGCAKKEKVPEVKDAFATAPPEQKQMASDAVVAFEKKDYPTAVANLDSLRRNPTLNVDQTMAVQDLMSKYQSELAVRAEAGDKDAQATLRMLQARPR